MWKCTKWIHEYSVEKELNRIEGNGHKILTIISSPFNTFKIVYFDSSAKVER